MTKEVGVFHHATHVIYPFWFCRLGNTLRVLMLDRYFVAVEVSIRRNTTVGLPNFQGQELTISLAGCSSTSGLERLLSSHGQSGMFFRGRNSRFLYSARDTIRAQISFLLQIQLLD